MPITRADGAELLRRVRDTDHDDAPPTTRRAVPSAIREAAAARHLERMPLSSDYRAFLANVTAGANANANAITSVGAARDEAVQTKMDGVRNAFSGPYVVDGAQVTARPMFRMLHPKGDAIVAIVTTCAKRAGVQPGPAIVGQCTPKELVKITQALIDAGRLPPGSGDVATRIRQMQWDHGIGVDCAGYSKQAIAATAARVPRLYAPGIESFRDLDGERKGSFARVAIADARPGDLLTLDAIAPEIYGHNVVVYSHATSDDAQTAALSAKHGPYVAAFLASAGPHHVLEVDSSWGAGADGNPCGGFRRDTWIYDASTKAWGSFDPRTTPPRFEISTRGPSGDAYHATYRPR